MGLFDILRGKPKIKGPAPDRLFAISTAYVTMEIELSMKSTGRAAIVFQPIATQDFDAIVTDMEEVLGATGTETGTTIAKQDDSFGYRWMILQDDDFEDLVVGLNAVNTALQDGGYGDRDKPAHPVDAGAAVASERGVDEPAEDDASDPAEDGEPQRDVVLVARGDELSEQADDDARDDHNDDL